MEKAFETDNLSTHNERAEYEPYAAMDASVSCHGANNDAYELVVDNMRPLEVTWHPDDLSAHERACLHAVARMLKDKTLFSDSTSIVREVAGKRAEFITREKLRYDILQHLDIRNRNGVRILTPVGIVHHVLAVLLASLPREHPPPSKTENAMRFGDL